ncbi:DHA2 family lincomycin resistance protein-like MFS transporter [Marmoricola sp. OAE513]|uniref:DHA2 family efflux MFS transporter permease subunit n=1 Tax=Marmoricola sp. OAE513 TaxID=2817894 RepID=UPI001DC94149
MQPTPTSAAAGGERTSPKDMAVLRWLVAATFIVILNETIMINAVPDLTRHFGVSDRAAAWLTTAFMLTMAVVIPITGWFLQRVTTRQAFGLAMAVFCTGTLLAAVTPQSMFWVLIVARVIQAAGTAVMMPLLMTTLMNVVPESDRGRVMGNVTLAMSVAPAMGPAVSGLILNALSWRWMFLLVLPVAALIGLAGLRKLTNVGEPTAGSIDVISVIASALGFGGLVYGLSLIGDDKAPIAPGILIAIGVAVLALFVLRQLILQRVDRPLLDLRAFNYRTFTMSLVLMAVAFMVFLSVLFLLPQYLQKARHLSELQTGFLLMPGGLAMGLLGPRVGKVFDKVGGRPLVIPGSIAIFVSVALFTQVDLETPYAVILAMHIVMMIGLAMVFTPVFTLGLGALPQKYYSHGSSLLGALQQVAGAAGAAVSVAVLSARAKDLSAAGDSFESAFTGGMERAFMVGAAFAIVVVAIAFVLPGRLPEQENPSAPVAGASDDDLLGEAESATV